MTRRDHSGDIGGGRFMPDASVRQDQQNVDVNKTMKVALDGAQSTLDRYGDVVLAAHRRFAVLMWRDTLPLRAANDGTSPLIAQRAISTYLAHAAALAEIAANLQLKCATIFQQRS